MQGQLTPSFGDYELIDTGDFEKLERFGQYVARRPEPQAIWRRSLPEGEWRRMADAAFLRDVRSDERGEWRLRPACLRAGRWPTNTRIWRFVCAWGSPRSSMSAFSPEQAANWNFIYDNCRALVSGGTFPADISGAAAAGSSLPAHDVAVHQAPDRAGTGTLPPGRGVASRRAC